ncbi:MULTISPECIES: transporter [Cysteiniphilum]|uniref:transporter n=1 Tax=Cysteiniphilum TaxID=2056696 RepID=UPI00177D2F1C|nr:MULTISPECIES: transporter [Cysteiniphilum]
MSVKRLRLTLLLSACFGLLSPAYSNTQNHNMAHHTQSTDALHHHHQDANDGMWMFDIMTMYMNMDGFQSGDSGASEPDGMMVPKQMHMYMTMFMAMYMTHDWDIMVMSSYNVKTMDMDMHMMGVVEGSTMKSEGFGDTEVTGGYNLINNVMQKLQIRGGISLPTGRINYQSGMPMMDTTLFGYNMQMGSGTFDPIFGVNYAHYLQSLTLGSEFNAVLRLYDNYRDYQLGDVYSANIYANYQLSSMLEVGSKLEYLMTTKTSGVANGTKASWGISYDPESTGGETINLSMMAKLKGYGLLQDSALTLEVGYPVYQNLNGTQMKQAWQASLHFSFNI